MPPTKPPRYPVAPAADSLRSVTIGLMDGQSRTGRMGAFTPQMPDVPIHEHEGTGPKVFLPAESIAFVAFHRSSDESPGPRRSAARKTLRIHVVGGRSFSVEADVGALSHPLGFYATPVEPESPVREYFFYAHAVNAKEHAEPIGSLLVKGGLLATADVERGMAAQSSQRKTLGAILVEQEHLDPAAVEQAAALHKRKHLRIGELLVEAGLVTAEAVTTALAEQKRQGGKRIGEVLVELGLITETELASALASKFMLPFVNLEEYPINRAAASEVGRELIERFGVLPVETDLRSLTVAIHDPLGIDVIEALRFHLKKRIHEVLTTRSQLKAFVAAYLAESERAGTEEVDLILKEMAEDDTFGVLAPADDDKEVVATDSSVIKLVNQILIDAYRRGASDIHVEPNGKEHAVVVRFRVDGDCIAYQELPSSVRGPLVARLKIMASLDISERRKPQDGKIRFRIRDKPIELRVATIPTVNQNEDVVLRILAASKPLPLERMGMSERNLRELKHALTKPYGLILCVGPTGSGKTTTLHSALGHINTVDMKIWTAEDPVEITQAGLRQVQVQPKIGLTFATAMRAFLRADPDVIMVGEMRDQETASTAVEASLTGHLVLSTLHTNSAPETVTRLVDMGIDPFSFADALIGVLAQRLARGLCKECRVQYEASQLEHDELAKVCGAETLAKAVGHASAFKLWRANGCKACGDTGYKGRLGLHELLIADDSVKHAIQQKAQVGIIRELAIAAGMTTLLQDGIQKVLAGLTDMKQVLAVCSR